MIFYPTHIHIQSYDLWSELQIIYNINIQTCSSVSVSVVRGQSMSNRLHFDVGDYLGLIISKATVQ